MSVRGLTLFHPEPNIRELSAPLHSPFQVSLLRGRSPDFTIQTTDKHCAFRLLFSREFHVLFFHNADFLSHVEQALKTNN